MALIQKKSDAVISNKIGVDDKRNEVIVQELVRLTMTKLTAATDVITSTELREKIKATFDFTLKQFFDYRDSMAPHHWEKSRLMLINELKNSVRTFCFEFTSKCSGYLSEAGLSFRTQVATKINSKCMPLENLSKILSDVKAIIIKQYGGSAVLDSDELNKRIDEEIQLFISENNKRLAEIYRRYNSILDELLENYEFLVEMKLPDDELENASEQRLESTFKFCKNGVLRKLNEKMQFDIPEMKVMFENQIVKVLAERFSQKSAAAKLRQEKEITEAAVIVKSAVKNFAEYVTTAFGKITSDSEMKSMRDAKMNEFIVSITDSIYDVLSDRKDAKLMLETAKQKMEDVFENLLSQRNAEAQQFQVRWEAELRSICDKLNQRLHQLCESHEMLEVKELKMERDVMISELLRKVNWLNADKTIHLLGPFKDAAKEEMNNLSSPILESHSKILENNFERQKDAMKERLVALEKQIRELTKGNINDGIYIEAQKLGETALKQLPMQIKNGFPVSAAATERLRKDFEEAMHRIQEQFTKEVEDRKLAINAEVSQLLTDVVDDYKLTMKAFVIASNYSKDKIDQIHNCLENRARSNLLKSLRLAKYFCDLTEQLRKLEELIAKSYNDTSVATNKQLSEWDNKLVSHNQKTTLHYKQLFNSKLGSAASEENLKELHENLKEEVIALWEESFPSHYVGDKMLTERRRFADHLNTEFVDDILQRWHGINSDVDRETRNAIENIVKNYEEQMEKFTKRFDFVTDETIVEKHSQFSKVASNDLSRVHKPKKVNNKVYDDLLSARIMSTLDCFLIRNKQKKETIQSDLSDEVNRLKDTLRRQVSDLKVLPPNSQLFDTNLQRARRILAKYKMPDNLQQELASFAEAKLREILSDITSEWDSTQPDSNQLQLAINAAISEYSKEMENRTCKTGQIYRNKAMKKYHLLSLQIVQEKFQGAVKQTPAAREQFDKAIGEVLKKFEDQNDLRAAEHSEAAVGIDLGTTFSCVAVYKGGKIEMIPDREHHSNTVPSYVYYESDTKTVVGHSAKDQSIIHPHTTIFDSKRLIGRKFEDPETQKDITQWPFRVIPDPERKRKEPKIEVHGKTFHPEEVSSEILKHLKKNAELYLDREVIDVVITVPAYFNDAQKRATKTAATLAGINVLEIINEPTSAAIAYSLNYTDGKKKNILVFDLGGGTFDTSILSTENCNIQVKAVGGDNHLGGEDFDSNMVDFCIEKFRQATGLTIPKNVSSSLVRKADNEENEEETDDEENEEETDDDDKKEESRKVFETLRRLRQKCEQAKINLSKTDKVRVVVDYIYKQKNLDVEITVEDFNNMNKQLFDKCINIVRKTVDESKLSKTEITDVVLVGGSSRIPEVQTLLTEFFDGKSLIMTLNPDEVVAQGAAYRAAMLSGSNSRELGAVTFQDVNPLSLGIEVIGGRFSIILPKNTPLPAKRTETYYTVRDYQTAISVAVYEGEETKVRNNNLLGEFALTNIPSKKKGEEPVEVTIDCDNEGLIHVTAKIRSNEKSQDIKIQSNRGGLTEEDIEKALSRQAT